MTSKEIISIGAALVLFLSATGGFILWKKPFSVKSSTAIAYAQAVKPERNLEPHIVMQKNSPFEAAPSAQAAGTDRPEMNAPPIQISLTNPGATALPLSKIYVISVATSKKGNNTAVISNSEDEISVKENANSKYGYVSQITKEGVVLDGKFLSIAEQAPTDKTITAVPPIPGTAYRPPVGGK